jgi:hypothetical protein
MTKVVGIWVEGESEFNSHDSIIRAFSDVAGVTVRGAVVIDGGNLVSYNDDIAAATLVTRTPHFPDTQGMSRSFSESDAFWYFNKLCQIQTLPECGLKALGPRLMLIAAKSTRPVTLQGRQ